MNRLRWMPALRIMLLLVIALDLAMIAARVSMDPRLLRMPGGSLSPLQAAALLIIFAGIVIWATRGETPIARVVLSEGTAVGIVCGVLEVAHIALEDHGDLGARAVSILTGACMLGLLLLWGLAGYRATRKTGILAAGPLAGSWGALVGMLAAVSYGFSQLFWSLPRLEQRNVGSPDWLRSGWDDLHLFTIADVFDAGFKILLTGPIAGAILGGLGAVMARAIRAPHGGEQTPESPTT